jgi:hypothetical protein
VQKHSGLGINLFEKELYADEEMLSAQPFYCTFLYSVLFAHLIGGVEEIMSDAVGLFRLPGETGANWLPPLSATWKRFYPNCALNYLKTVMARWV